MNLSEPENSALAAYIQTHTNIKGYIDFHSYSQVVTFDPKIYKFSCGCHLGDILIHFLKIIPLNTTVDWVIEDSRNFLSLQRVSTLLRP